MDNIDEVETFDPDKDYGDDSFLIAPLSTCACRAWVDNLVAERDRFRREVGQLEAERDKLLALLGIYERNETK